MTLPPRPDLRPRDAAVVLALAWAMVAEGLWFPVEPEPLSAAAWVLVPLTVLPVLWRRTAPALGLFLAVAALFPVTTVCPIVQTAPFPAMLCGYWLARTRGRRAALTAGLLLVPYVLFLLSRHGLDKLLTLETPKNLVFIALPLVLGLTTRYRERSVQALVERAETAERTREEEALRRVGEERLRIARDVHDVVAHSMVAINVQAGVGAHLIDRDVERARRTLEDIRRISAETLTDLRSILGVLREEHAAAPVEPAATLAALPDLVDGLRTSGLEVDAVVEVGAAPLPTAVDVTAFRVVQEALTNVLRHAGSHRATVRVGDRVDAVEVEVVDAGSGGLSGDGEAGEGTDGTGTTGVRELPPHPVPSGSGNGLRGMRERVETIGGSFEAGPDPRGPGWRVWARLPLRTDSTDGTDAPDGPDTAAGADAPALAERA